MQQNTGIPVRTGVSRAYRYGSAVRYVPVHTGVFGSLYENCRSSVTRHCLTSVIKWRKKIILWWKTWGEKEVFGDGSDLRKERLIGTLSKTLQCALTAVSVWNWLVVHPIFKLTLDDTILSNKLLDRDLNPWFKLKLQLWFFNISFFFPFFFLLFIIPCSITERFTVLICLVYKHLFFLSSSFYIYIFYQFLVFFFAFFVLFFLLKIHTRQR